MKILIIRLSSMGDIILTSPVARCLKQRHPDAELHYLVKAPFVPLVECSPYVAKVHTLGPLADTLSLLQSEHYDYVIDLQHNHRSAQLRRRLRCPSSTCRKEDLRRLWLVLTKRNILKHSHVVQRYLQAAAPLGISDDGLPLNLFYRTDSQLQSHPLMQQSYVAIACGAQHTTKQIPPAQLRHLVQSIEAPIVLLGDESDGRRIAEALQPLPHRVLNLCGHTTLHQLAQWIDHAAVVIAADTGIMHIAAALQRPLVVVWGSTTPQLGFAPYRTDALNSEVPLPCRPCSKVGKEQCPRRHLRCLTDHPWTSIAHYVNQKCLGIKG